VTLQQQVQELVQALQPQEQEQAQVLLQVLQ
jgi:hypothetical protein